MTPGGGTTYFGVAALTFDAKGNLFITAMTRPARPLQQAVHSPFLSALPAVCMAPH